MKSEHKLNADSGSRLVYGKEEDLAAAFMVIFIPTYKRLDTLKTLVGKILSIETSVKYKILILDDSADFSAGNSTKKYIEDINRDEIVYYINEQNMGQAGCWNQGIVLCRNELIAMCHDDDMISECYFDKMSAALSRIDKSRLGFVQCAFKEFSTDGQLCGLEKETMRDRSVELMEYRLRDCLYRRMGPTNAPTCGIVFSRSAVLKVGGFDEKYFPSHDHVLGFQLLRHGYAGYKVRSVLGYYRWGLNDSYKKEVAVGFVDRDRSFRINLLYPVNPFYKIHGKIFENAIYSMSVDLYYKAQKRINDDVDKDEFIHYPGYGSHKITSFILRAVTSLHARSARRRIRKIGTV